MKTKNRIFLFMGTILFLVAVLIGFDAANKIAKACDYSTCVDSGWTDTAACDACDATGAGTTTTDTSYAYDQAMCDSVYGTGYVPNADGTGCDLGTPTGYAYDQAMCDSVYGTGYTPNSSGTGCDPLGVGGSDFNTCIAEGGTIDDCMQFDDGSHCTTNADCTNKNAGIYCDQATRLCGDSSTGTSSSGDICYTDSECNWYSRCKLGTNGATGVCQGYLNPSSSQSKIDSLLGLPAGSTVSASGLVTAANGIISQLTPAQIAQLQGANASGTLGSPIAGTSSGVYNLNCGAGYTKISGVCFPTTTGLANPTGGIRQIIMNLFGWLMGLFTTLAILAFVISGIQYLLAAGDEGLAETAKTNATNAVIGIIVGLSGFIIIQAISAALSGTTTLF